MHGADPDVQSSKLTHNGDTVPASTPLLIAICLDSVKMLRHLMDANCIFAVDELCGFLVACALVRPSKSLQDLEVSSVKKKLKDKAFARGVNRDDVVQGAAELGVPLDDHIGFVLEDRKSVV